MEVIANIILSILSFFLAAISLHFVNLTLKQNTRILEQGQKQFDESKRLEYQPYLQLELVKDWSDITPQYEISIPIEDRGAEPIYAFCRIKNVGNGTATNLILSWKSEEPSCSDSIPFPVNAVMKGDEYSFQVTIDKESIIDSFRIKIVWQCEDILGNTYEQESYLHYEDENLVCIDNNIPVFLGKVKYTLDKKK